MLRGGKLMVRVSSGDQSVSRGTATRKYNMYEQGIGVWAKAVDTNGDVLISI